MFHYLLKQINSLFSKGNYDNNEDLHPKDQIYCLNRNLEGVDSLITDLTPTSFTTL